MGGQGRWPIVLAVVAVTAGAGVAGASQASDSIVVLGVGGATGGLIGLAGSLLLERTRSTRNARRDARERRDAALAPVLAEGSPPQDQPVENGLPDVTELLSGESCPAPFRGRKRESDRILDWCLTPGHPLLVLTGSAGAGKTRLARYVASRLGSEWVVGWVREGAGGSVVTAAREAADPALLLIDDADIRADLSDLLRSLTPWHTDDRAVRVLMVVRDRAALRRAADLPERDRPGFDRTLDVALTPLGGDDDRRRWYAEAVAAYAARLRMAAPPPLSPSLVPGGGRDEPLMLLQAQALLAVLDGESGDAAGMPPAELPLRKVLGALLAHEAVRWADSAAQPRWGVAGLTDTTAAEVMAALTLLGADSEATALEVVRRVPAFHPDPAAGITIDAERVRNVTRWACGLYGSPKVPWTVRIRPGLLADWLIIERLAASTEFARNLFAGLYGRKAIRAMTTLIRAARVFPEALDQLDVILRADAPERLAVAVTAVLHTGPVTRALDTGLAAAIDATSLDPEQLADLLNAIPEYELLRTRVALFTQQVTQLRSDESSVELAASLRRLGTALGELGRWEKARQHLVEAIAIHRELAEQNPAAHRSDLAVSLNNLGTALGELGRWEKARQLHVEAIAIHRELAEQNPAAHRNDEAGALTNLGAVLRKLGRPEEARQHLVEAVAIRRKLAEQNPAAHRSDLAVSMDNLGTALGELGRWEKARQLHVEAIAIHRELAEQNPAAHRSDLAVSLNNLGAALGELGRPERARQHFVEAVAIRRKLAEQNPTAHRSDLAVSMDNLGTALRALGRWGEARRYLVGAVAIHRELAEQNPTAHRNNLAGALDSLGGALYALGRWGEARQHLVEAVEIYRELAEQNPTAHRNNLAGALTNLGGALYALGRWGEARQHLVEAVEIYRELAEENPGAFRQRHLELRGWLQRQLNAIGDEAAAIRLGMPEKLGIGESSPARDDTGPSRADPLWNPPPTWEFDEKIEE